MAMSLPLNRWVPRGRNGDTFAAPTSFFDAETRVNPLSSEVKHGSSGFSLYFVSAVLQNASMTDEELDEAMRRRRKNQPWLIPLALAVLVIVFIAVVLLVFNSRRKDARDTSSPNKPDAKEKAGPAGAVGEVNGGTLWMDYEENAAGADSKYTGKTIRVSGQVHSVSAGDDAYRVGFTVYYNGNAIAGARPGTIALFPSEKRGSLSDIGTLDEVVIRGRCLGRKADIKGHKGYVVIVENCELVSRKKFEFNNQP